MYSVTILIGACAAVTAVLLYPYVVSLLMIIGDRRKGIDMLLGSNSNEMSKRHLLYVISKARISLDVCSGSLHASVWTDEVKNAIRHAMVQHPSLEVRILTGKVLDGFLDGTHPIIELFNDIQNDDDIKRRLEIRRLKRYPSKGQGKYADGNLYVELEDSRDTTNRRFIAYYQDYLPDPARVAVWCASFETLWNDELLQLPGLPVVESTVARDPHDHSPVAMAT